MASDIQGKNIITEVEDLDPGIPLTENTRMYIDHEYSFRQIKMSYLFDWVKSRITKVIYPVGSVYMTFEEVNPSSIFGGTWEKVKGEFLLGSGSNYSLGSHGGETTHTLNGSEMPIHNHTASSTSSGDHNHSANAASAGSHTHTITITNNGSHSHSATVSPEGNHYHSPSNSHMFTTNAPIATEDVARRLVETGKGQNYALTVGLLQNIANTAYTNSAGVHGHTVTINSNGSHGHSASATKVDNHNHSVSIGSSGSHVHSISINNTGGGKPHNNMPPYVVVNIWKRTA